MVERNEQIDNYSLNFFT